MTWQLCILLQTIFVATGIVTLRVLAREKRLAGANFVITALSYVALYGTVLLFVPLLGHVNNSVMGSYWWRFIGGGFMFALTNAWTYKTLVYFDAAIATIASTLNTIFSVIGAVLFLNEDLTAMQLVGAFILMLAITYGVLASHSKAKKNVRRSAYLGMCYAVLAGLSFAVAILNEKWLLERMNVATYGVYGIGGQFVMIVASAILLQSKQLRLVTKPFVLKWSLLTGVLRGIGGVLFIMTEVKSNNVALASVIANFRMIIVIFLGAWLLKEHQHMRQKLIAASTSIGGMVVMFWK